MLDHSIVDGFLVCCHIAAGEEESAVLEEVRLVSLFRHHQTAVGCVHLIEKRLAAEHSCACLLVKIARNQQDKKEAPQGHDTGYGKSATALLREGCTHSKVKHRDNDQGLECREEHHGHEIESQPPGNASDGFHRVHRRR